jgi:hypothetical protein
MQNTEYRKKNAGYRMQNRESGIPLLGNQHKNGDFSRLKGAVVASKFPLPLRPKLIVSYE